MTALIDKANFELGTLMLTSRVNNRVADDTEFAKFVVRSLRRHAVCDWGDVCLGDKKSNDESLTDGARIMSAYDSQVHPKIWIITDADRTVTTILFPDEY